MENDHGIVEITEDLIVANRGDGGIATVTEAIIAMRTTMADSRALNKIDDLSANLIRRLFTS